MEELEKILEKLGMSSYQSKVLLALFRLGESKASEISELSGVPRPKVYEVLDQLSEMGLLDKIPTRPVKFRVKRPEEVISRLRKNMLLEYEDKLKFLDANQKILVQRLYNFYSPTEIRTKELIRVLKVGEASERETRIMYSEAEKEIDIISRSFEYYPKVRKELVEACSRGVKIKVLLLGRKFIDERTEKVQGEIIKLLSSDMDVEIKMSKTTLPLRGSIIDSSYDYSSGKAIFVVEDPEIPLYLRDAAVTENPSLVAGMKKYFDLIWEYESEDVK